MLKENKNYDFIQRCAAIVKRASHALFTWTGSKHMRCDTLQNGSALLQMGWGGEELLNKVVIFALLLFRASVELVRQAHVGGSLPVSGLSHEWVLWLDVQFSEWVSARELNRKWWKQVSKWRWHRQKTILMFCDLSQVFRYVDIFIKTWAA